MNQLPAAFQEMISSYSPISFKAFLFNYGLFALEVITFVALILFGIAGLVMILSSRGSNRETIEIEKINDKFDTLREALEAEILSKDELKQLKKQRKKEEKQEAKLQKKKAKAEKAKGEKISGEVVESKGRVFVLKFNGDVNASEVNNLREAITAILTVATTKDEVVVIIDSPGGLVHSYGLAASELERIRSRDIQLTASVDYVAASGGYLMASVAHKIIAAPFAIIGSIGVLAQIPNINRLLEKHDIDIEQHTAGEYKTTLTLLGKNTDKARKKFREELEDTHQLFKQFVHMHRKDLDIDKLATGEYWYGTQALTIKLIDEIMTSDDYLLEKSKNHDIFQVDYVIAGTLSDKLSNALENFTMASVQKIWQKLTTFRAY